MQQIKRIGSMVSLLTAVFLFTYSVSFAQIENYQENLCCSISKQGTLPFSPDNQFPFEEKEEEASDEFPDGFSLVYIPAEPITIISLANPYRVIHKTLCTENIRQHVPIYLAQRALII